MSMPWAGRWRYPPSRNGSSRCIVESSRPALVELDAPVIGSQGTLRADGTPYLRMISTVMKVDFDNSDIAFTHETAPDFEAIAALDPDLIIGLVSNDADSVGRLERIAPTILLDDTRPALDLYRDIAAISGRLETYEDLLADYQALVADARGWIGDHELTYSMLGARGSDLYVFGNYGAVTKALNDLGLALVGDGVALAEQGSTWDGEIMSAELLPAQEADLVFSTYRIDLGPEASPAETLTRFEMVLPGFCDLLPACDDGRFVILPQEHAAVSFRTLEANIHYVVTHVGSRPDITRTE